MYEYVPRPEYLPVRKELEEIIHCAQKEMRERYKLTFQFHLIGSGRKHLVTRVQNGNGGFDFDYDLILPRPPACKPAELKQRFMDAFAAAVQGTGYSFPKDSTSVLTIKNVDQKQKKVRHSCDFAIVYYADGKCYYLHNDKQHGVYTFAFRATRFDVRKQVDAIRKRGEWERLRKEYLKLKNINEGKEKRSLSLYVEAVDNVYNQLFLQ